MQLEWLWTWQHATYTWAIACGQKFQVLSSCSGIPGTRAFKAAQDTELSGKAGSAASQLSYAACILFVNLTEAAEKAATA